VTNLSDFCYESTLHNHVTQQLSTFASLVKVETRVLLVTGREYVKAIATCCASLFAVCRFLSLFLLLQNVVKCPLRNACFLDVCVCVRLAVKCCKNVAAMLQCVFVCVCVWMQPAGVAGVDKPHRPVVVFIRDQDELYRQTSSNDSGILLLLL